MLQLIAQLGTGTGKSKVIAPLIQLLRRRYAKKHSAKKLVTNIWPSPLYHTNKSDMRRRVIEAFDQQADAFEFNRSSNISNSHLVFRNRELLRALKEERQLNGNPESFQSFELKFLELLYLKAHALKANQSHETEACETEKILRDLMGEFAVTDENYQENLLTMRDMLKTFKQSEVHIDEGHINLAPKRETNFTIGESSFETMANIEAIEGIYRFLITDAELSQKVQIKENLSSLMSSETFRQEVAVKLIEYMRSTFNIDEEKKQDFFEYVLGVSKAIPDWVKTHEKLAQIALLRGQVRILLPECLKRIVNVHFGISKKYPEIEFSKPYDASDSCVESAEIDNIHEAINKTYQIYLHKGLSIKQQTKLIRYLQEKALKEGNELRKDPKNTPTYQFFLDHFPKDAPNLFFIDEDKLQQLQDHINNDIEIIFYYLKTMVIPTIKKFSKKLKSNPQNLRSMFNSIVSMTATPGSWDIYGPQTQRRKDKKNKSLIIDTLKTKCANPKTIHTLSKEDPKEVLSELLTQTLAKDPQYRMIIDIGALFHGISNREVAEAILKNCPKTILGIVFFENDQLVCLEDGKVIPFDQSQLKPKQRFTYCDNKHMFGADIPQTEKAKGLVTYSKHTDLDDMIQGSGRLRGLLKQQTIEWALTEKTRTSIAGQSTRANIDLLLENAKRNQTARKKDDNYRSLKQQMHNEIRSKCIEKILKASSSEEMIKLFLSFESIFVEKTPEDPFELYGQIDEEISGAQSLQNYRKELQQQLKELKGFNDLEKEEIEKKLSSYEELIEKMKEKLSEKVIDHKANLGTESEIQVQTQTQVKLESQSNNQNQNSMAWRDETPWPSNLNLFKDNWCKTTAPRSILRTLERKLFKTLANSTEKFSKLIYKPYDKIASILDRNPEKNSRLKNIVKKIVKFVNICFAIPGFICLGCLWLPIGILAGIRTLGRKITSSKTKFPLFKASDVLYRHPNKNVKKAASLFKDSPNSKLMMTDNFIQLVSNNLFQDPVVPLSNEQKSLYELLVIQDTNPDGTKTFTVLMGDQSTDVKFWREKLEEDHTKTPQEEAQNRKRKICLYDLNLGIVLDSKNPFDEQELEQNKDFMELIIKTKLYNGDIHYSNKQEEVLLSMAKDEDARKTLSNFFKVAISCHDSKKKKQDLAPKILVA